MTLTMIDGEPVILIWQSAEIDAALAAADDMGLPIARPLGPSWRPSATTGTTSSPPNEW